MEWKKLSPEEERVIVNKGTERAFTGEYTDLFESGTYHCKRCDAALYKSNDKFHSNCGWPSFDDEIEGAVKRYPDTDGRRTEIVCANCNGHLGHVFTGEGFTDKNTRHCVNSISLVFKPDNKFVSTDTAIFAAGCFWGVEYYFQQLGGVIGTKVGYTGGHKENPTYKEVCSHTTGHIEAIEIIYDPSQVSYEKLCKYFFEIHDFTQTDGQGPDIGPQYLSVVFIKNLKEKATVEKVIQTLQNKGYQVATQIKESKKFWPAEEYHQMYYDKNGKTPYCHRHQAIF